MLPKASFITYYEIIFLNEYVLLENSLKGLDFLLLWFGFSSKDCKVAVFIFWLRRRMHKNMH